MHNVQKTRELPPPLNAQSAVAVPSNPQCALVVMAKAPLPGLAKTRLSPALAPAEAAQLSSCFLHDTLSNIATAAGDGHSAGIVAYTPREERPFFEAILPAGFALIPQNGIAFGDKLLAAAASALSIGHTSVCLIDSDSPTLPHAILHEAVAELARPGDRVILGPAQDGGYYLIGLKNPHSILFDRIDWSTPLVAEQTRERAREAGLEIIELPVWYDVDDGPSLEILKAELLSGVAPSFAALPGYPAPFTRAFLGNLEPASKALPPAENVG